MNEEGGVHSKKFVSPNATDIGCPPDVSHADKADEQKHWYVMRSTYSREIKAKELLEAEGVTCYVPMKRVRSEHGDKMLPAVHNLLFVHTNRDFMDKWKRRHEEDCPLRYVIDKTSSQPMIVLDKAMEDFIRVTKNSNEQNIYLDNPNVAISKGKKVKIVCGQYAGVCGTVLRILRDRKVVVSVNGLVAIAINGIPFSWMKEI